MRDGIRLATDIYLPVAVTPVAAVLVRLPYDKSGEFSFMSPVAQRLTDRGYAVVVQDVRGKVRSEGETFAFVHEVADGADTLDWIVAQPWSNGRVGMFGDSYYGFTQWAALASGHPALQAMVPRMTTTEVGTDWMYNQGVFCSGTMIEWAVHTWAEASLLDHKVDWSVRPLADVVPATLDGRRSASLDSWWPRPPNDPFWTRDIFNGRPPRPGRIPTLHVGGFYDVFSRGQLRDHARSLRGALPSDQYLEMGATDHFDDRLGADGRAPDYLQSAALLDTFLDEQYLPAALTFFERYLRDGTQPPARVRWELGRSGWQESATWPPAAAAPVTLYLGDAPSAGRGPQGGALLTSPERFPAEVSWVHDPSRPVPSLVEDPWRPLLRLPDEREIQVRDDVVTFTGEPQRSALDLAGPVRVIATSWATARSTHLVARLSDVAPTGEARMIVEGACLVTDIADPRVVDVDLGDTGYQVHAGHRLRLSLSSSSYPRWAIHPGTDDHPFRAIATRAVTHRLRLSGTDATRLVITALPATHP